MKEMNRREFLTLTGAAVVALSLAGVVFTILGIITLVGIVASSDTMKLL